MAFLGTGWGLYGQCSCSGSYYYYDGDGVGIRGTARLLGISPTTLIARKKRIAAEIKEPVLVKGKTYEVDELRTFIKKRKVDLGG